MTHLRIEQNNNVEIITYPILNELYRLFASGSLDAGSRLTGNLFVNRAKQSQLDVLQAANPDLTITVTGDMYLDFEDPVVEEICAANWGDGMGITAAQAAAVTSLGEAFKGNTQITSFDELKYFTGVTRLPVTNGAAYNGSGPFANCTNLRSIDLTNITEIGRSCFYNCSSLTSVKNTGNLKYITIDNYGDYAFGDCTSLTTIDLSNVVSIGNYGFSGCTALSNIGNLNKIKSLGSFSFGGCTSLEIDVELPSYEKPTASNSTKLAYAFSKSGIKSIKNTGNATGTDGEYNRFGGSWGYYGVCNGCTKLDNVTLSDKFTSIGTAAFKGCSNIRWFKCFATTPPTLKAASNPSDGEFPFNTNYTWPIYVPDASVSAYQAADGWSALASRIKPLSDFATDFPDD